MILITIRRILLGLTLGVLLALLIAPQTRWLLQTQFLPLLHLQTTLFTPQAESAARVKAIAAQYPNDYQIQYAAALWTRPSPATDTLRALEAHFPDSASLRANILRYACIRIHPYRDENYLLEQMPVPSSSQQQPPPDPAALAAFDRDAAAGERLDPNNAYFPFMYAVGLYAAHQDAAAQTAILRAGADTKWDEYTQDEIEGRWRLDTVVFGGGANDALARSAIAAAQLFPQYADLREVTRVATYQAIEAEEAGNFSRGTALRQALIHCGGLMRAQSSPLIGSLVGMAIASEAMARPGGTLYVKPSASNSVQLQRNRAAHLMAYVTYLRRHGDDTGASQAAAEGEAEQQARLIMAAYFNRSTPYVQMQRLIPWWITGLMLLTNALWLLICGGIARLMEHYRPAGRHSAIGVSLLLLVIGGALAVWTTQSVREYDVVVRSLYGVGETPSSGFALWAMVFPALRPILITLAALAAPLLMLLAGLVRLHHALVRQTIAAAMPLACLVLLAYVGVTLVTAQQERVINNAVTQRLLQGEGQYTAAQAGQIWPGVVD